MVVLTKCSTHNSLEVLRLVRLTISLRVLWFLSRPVVVAVRSHRVEERVVLSHRVLSRMDTTSSSSSSSRVNKGSDREVQGLLVARVFPGNSIRGLLLRRVAKDPVVVAPPAKEARYLLKAHPVPQVFTPTLLVKCQHLPLQLQRLLCLCKGRLTSLLISLPCLLRSRRTCLVSTSSP